ncbi:MAG TPA: hypothetical protein VK518_20715 [Puia sp.]|nr:hypothetical protein [Puia sp.]
MKSSPGQQVIVLGTTNKNIAKGLKRSSSNNMLQDFIHIIKKVQEKISDDSDVVWTRYSTPEEMRAGLDIYLQQLQAGNTSCLQDLNILFAPTGAFQEHSICYGWADEYLRLAKEFDSLYKSNA